MLTFFKISFLIAVIAALLQLKYDLMMLQQNSYRNERYRHWQKETHANSSFVVLIGILLVMVGCLRAVSHVWIMVIACLYSALNIFRLVTAKYKKPLVWTRRAKRIYYTAVVLIAALCAFVSLLLALNDLTVGFYLLALYAILVFCWSGGFILAANWVLKPVEKHINKRYYDDAARILQSMPDLKIIGVTGSYGKTSTKHYLHRILSEQYDVAMTPGNFNTTLGVIRTIRENLKPYNEVFIVEMGAKQPNDIKEICDLVHPSIGIVTAVGPQHLESFGSIENVQATKFELIDSLPADGLAVVNNDFEHIANRKVDNVECIRYSVDSAPVDYYAADIEYSRSGTSFSVMHNGDKVMDVKTRLVGSCNVSNLLAAIIVALRLGVSKDKIRYAVEKIEQVEHRLSMKNTPGGITIIDDAYNSNPVGSKMALEVLSKMTQGRRIVITPGMIELGQDQYDLNEKFGEEIGKCVDIAIIVGEYNRKAIVEGIEKSGFAKENVKLASTFAEAQSMLMSIARPGDTVLYENDLPDTFK